MNMRPSIVKHVLELKQKIQTISSEQELIFSEMKSARGYRYDSAKLRDKILPTLRMSVLQIMIETGFSWGYESFVSQKLLDDLSHLMNVLAYRIFSSIPYWKVWKSEFDIRAENSIKELYKIIDQIMKLMDDSEDAFTESVKSDGLPSITKRTLLHSLMLARKSSKVD